MAERGVESGSNGGEAEKSLKEKGNEFFKAGNYLKAAALYTQAIKLDPSNATLYRHVFPYCFYFVLLGFNQDDKHLRI